jgi:hypothetical protein
MRVQENNTHYGIFTMHMDQGIYQNYGDNMVKQLNYAS